MTNPTAPTPRSGIHPLIAAAAVSLIVLSGVGVAALTGLIGTPGAGERDVVESPAAQRTLAAPATTTTAAGSEAAPPAQAPGAPPAALGATSAPDASPPVGARDAARDTARDTARDARQPTAAAAPRPQPIARTDAPRAASGPLAAAGTPAARPAPAPDARAWATVESVREVRSAGAANGVGAVAGGVIGGVLGNQVGKGGGRTLATIAGAVGGGVLGHQAEKHVRADVRHEVTVRVDDGSVQTFARETPWHLRAGERVRMVDGRPQPGAAPRTPPAPADPGRDVGYGGG